MSARLKYFRPHNRLLRSAYDRAINIREDTRKGVDRKTDAARLMREVQALSGDIAEGAALHRSRVQYLQNLGIGPDAAAAYQHLNALGSMGARGMIPAIIAGANSGDAKAKLYAAAMVAVLSTMDQAQRPMTATKFARMISLPEYDRASVELEECQFLLDAMAVTLPRLANGQLPTAADMVTIGEKRRLLRDGHGMRDAEALADDDAELNSQHEKEPAHADDSTEHSDATNPDGQDRSGEADPTNPDASASGEADGHSEDQSWPSGAEGE